MDRTLRKPDSCGKGDSPFADAAALWHMGDLSDSAGKGPLTVHQNVKIGVELTGGDREASLERGGDGYAAEFHGGHLVAGAEAEEQFRLTGKEMTFCIRLKDSSGQWNSHLFGRYDREDPLSIILGADDVEKKPFLLGHPYYLFSDEQDTRTAGSRAVLQYSWRTKPVEPLLKRRDRSAVNKDPIIRDAFDGVMPLRVPVHMVGTDDWHDVVVRFKGPNLEMFVDGVLVDEDWPYGALYKFDGPFLIGAGFEDGQLQTGFRGLIDHVALWDRALSNHEIVTISGGEQHVADRDTEILGAERSSLQYWCPRGYNTYAGDTMLLFDGLKLHLFWLFDRRHHKSKWNLGAHQYAHATTEDLAHWEHHPLAIPLTRQWEAAMGTGDFMVHDGKFYGVYTDCGRRCQFEDKPHEGSGVFMAVSDDGVHFKKNLTPVVAGGDCTIFHDASAGLFHILTPGTDQDKKEGLVDWVSSELKTWTRKPQLFLDVAGVCPHYFQWNAWYYLTVSGMFWKSRKPLGPWTALAPQHIDQHAYRFPKTAPLQDNRRIAAAWISDGPWGNELVFRELVQSQDGSLGAKFPPEMIPPSGLLLELPFQSLSDGASGDGKRISIEAGEEQAAAVLAGVPQNVRITLQVRPRGEIACFGLWLRGTGHNPSGVELRFDPPGRSVQLGKALRYRNITTKTDCVIECVERLDRRFVLDIVVRGPLFDACIDNRRTIVTREANARGNRLFFFAQRGSVIFDSILVRPLGK